MQLLIINSDEGNLHLFCKFLINKIKQRIINLMDPAKYVIRDKILNEDENIIEFIGTKRNINCLVIMRQALNNLRYKSTATNEYIIDIDPNIYLYRTKTRLIEIIKLLEYGRSDLKPYPIFRRVFNDMAEELQDLYEEFIA